MLITSGGYVQAWWFCAKQSTNTASLIILTCLFHESPLHFFSALKLKFQEYSTNKVIFFLYFCSSLLYGFACDSNGAPQGTWEGKKKKTINFCKIPSYFSQKFIFIFFSLPCSLRGSVNSHQFC